MASTHGLTAVDPRGALQAVLPSIKTDIRKIVRTVCNSNDMPRAIADRVELYYSRCMDYNIVGGKLSRAAAVCEALRFCSGGSVDATSQEYQAALTLGWAVEILQAFFLIEDDVMDKGEKRRGQPCWYRVGDVGVANAINDGLLLEQVLYELVLVNESTRPFAMAAHGKLREASMRTVVGQHLDTHPPSHVLEFTRDQWLSVVRFKTAFYTFVLPCELGILVSGRTFSPTDLATFRRICLLLGELFQGQDDMLDCFGDPALIGKIGRDIEEGKCTWLWYTAIEAVTESANDTLKDELVSLYSSSEKCSNPEIVQRVKEIYRDLEVQSRFEMYVGATKMSIQQNMSQLESSELKELCQWMLDTTVGRSK